MLEKFLNSHFLNRTVSEDALMASCHQQLFEQTKSSPLLPRDGLNAEDTCHCTSCIYDNNKDSILLFALIPSLNISDNQCGHCFVVFKLC